LIFAFFISAMAGVFEESSPKTGTGYIVQDVHDVENQPHAGPLDPRDITEDGQIVTQHERQSLIRGLGQRHIQMIAIAGAIVCTTNPDSESPTNLP
jgi:amino acid transporter